MSQFRDPPTISVPAPGYHPEPENASNTGPVASGGKLIEPDIVVEGLTVDQFIAEATEDTLTNAHLRDLWLLYRTALVER